MTKLNPGRAVASLSFLALLALSCHKIDQPASPSVTSPVTLSGAGNVQAKKIDLEFGSTQVVFNAGEIVATASHSKLSVYLQADTQAVVQAGLKVLPLSYYSIQADNHNTIVLNGNQKVLSVSVSVPDLSLLEPGVAYGIGINLASANGVNLGGSENTLLIQVTSKNGLDGKYRLTGVHHRVSPLLNEPYDETVDLVTTGTNSVKMYWPQMGVFAHPIHAGTTYYSDFSTDFYFGTRHELVKVENPFNKTVTTFTVEANSRYNPSTKTIYARYFYNNDRGRLFTDTLIFLGSR